MKRLFQLIALITLGLSLFSCDKIEPRHKVKGNGELVKGQVFELNSSLGSVSLESLNSNTDKMSDGNLRAILHFTNSNSPAKTTLKAENFGADKRQARWGVLYNGNQHYALNCEEAFSVKPSNPSTNTVYFKETETNNTIEGASVRMYCYPTETLNDITKGIMLLEGQAGSEANSTKQYFKGETNPNHRIEGLVKASNEATAFQSGRHIPIMTKLVSFSEMSKPAATNTVKFAPRGSLVGLNIKNILNKDIIITAIVVKKSGALDYSGYFDWSQIDNQDRASFIAEYTSSQSGTALSFPVYVNGTATDVGYTIPQNNTEIPCFYLWGFQNPNKKGEALQVQIRYKIVGDNTEHTTQAFNIQAPNSIEDGVAKQFDDGYSYQTILTIKLDNQIGGSQGDDWTNDVVIPIAGGRTPLDFMAVYDVNNAPNGQKALRTSYTYPETDVIADLTEDNAGYYIWTDAVALFDGSNPALDSYLFPTKEQWQAMTPSAANIYFNREATKESFMESCRVGSLPLQEYSNEFVTIKEGNLYVTYALRFKDTEWESAWRYSFEGAKYEADPLTNTLGGKMIIKSVGGLKGTGTKLDDIKNSAFFENHPATIRILPCYGCIDYHYGDEDTHRSISWRGQIAYYWTATAFPAVNGKFWNLGFDNYPYATYKTKASIGHVNWNKRAYTIRPFYKQLP